MKNLLPILALLCMTSSCATILASRETRVKVLVAPGTKVVCHSTKDVSETATAGSSGRLAFSVLRSADPLRLTIKNDSISADLSVRPVLTSLYYANIYYTWGLGCIVDGYSPKRFTYRRIFVEVDEERPQFIAVRRQSYRAGSAEFVIVPPLLNGWAFAMGNLTPSGTPIGAGLGFNYHYARNRFISGDAGYSWVTNGAVSARRSYYFANDNVRLGPAVEQWGWYATLRHHHRIGRLDAGYGLSWGQRQGHSYYTNIANGYYRTEIEALRYNAFAIGASASVNFRITSSFFAGFNYMPQLLEIDKGMRFTYGHMVNFGLYWRIRLTAI